MIVLALLPFLIKASIAQDISVIANRLVVAGSIFEKQESPIYTEDALEEANIVDTLFDRTSKRSIYISSSSTNVILSLVCFYKPVAAQEEELIGLYCYINGNQVNTSQISMTGHNGKGHTSIHIFESSLFATCLNQSNDYFSNFCGPCYMRSNSNTRFLCLHNISTEKSNCFEINSRNNDISFTIFSNIKIHGSDILRFISGATGKITDCYFFENDGKVEIYNSNIACDRIYSDVSIAGINAVIGVGTMNKLVRAGAAIFCRIKRANSCNVNSKFIILNTFQLLFILSSKL